MGSSDFLKFYICLAERLVAKKIEKIGGEVKTKVSHSLKTTDLLGMIALLGVVACISSLIISQAMKDSDRTMALQEARNLAFQLVNGGFAAPMESARGPASFDASMSGVSGIFRNSGSIGKDPWGSAFQYSVVRNDQSRVTHVVVWSLGPNSYADTTEGSINRNVSRHEHIEFLGDDFGFIQPIAELSQSDTLIN